MKVKNFEIEYVFVVMDRRDLFHPELIAITKRKERAEEIIEEKFGSDEDIVVEKWEVLNG